MIQTTLLRAAALALVLAPAAVFAQSTSGSNPPGTAAGRALDRAAGTNTSGAYPSQSDGTPGNPPGTAAGRALDRAAGTNNSGAYPSQSDGTPGNPPGTAAGRAANRASNSAHRSTHHTQTLRNNSASRALDRAAGTDNSGAYPSQRDGTPGNPPGTAVSRTLGTTNPR